MMLEKQIVLKNLLVNYYASNQDKNAASSVIFLHGWGASGQIWEGALARFQGFNIFAPDLPGFGKSQVPGRPFSVQDYASVVSEFIHKAGVSKVVLAGHSFGGRVAIKLASMEGNKISKLVLVDSAGFKNESLRKKLIGAGAKVLKPFVPRALKNKLYRFIGAADYAQSGQLRETFVNIVSEDLTDDLKRINLPTLIIWGGDDAETPVEFGKRMHRLIPGSKFVILPAAGHYSFLDQGDKFYEALSLFISA